MVSILLMFVCLYLKIIIGLYSLLLVQVLCTFFFQQKDLHLSIDQFSGKLQKKSNKAFYSAVLVLLWISVIVSFAFDWIRLRVAFIVDNASPLGTLSDFNGINDLQMFAGIAGSVTIVISDAILVRLEIHIIYQQWAY